MGGGPSITSIRSAAVYLLIRPLDKIIDQGDTKRCSGISLDYEYISLQQQQQ